jgi:APA family basic amino acid/polyamine antiporter
MLIYLLMNAAFLSALTPAEMAGSPLVAQDAIAGAFGPAAGKVVLVAGLLILVSSLNVNFLGMPRVAFGLARNGLAPRAFTHVNPRGTPTWALLFITVLIGALAVSGQFELLIRFMMLVAISIDLMVMVGFFKLRRSRPELHRPLRVPAYPWLPGLTVMLYVLILATIVGTQPKLAIGGGLMIAGLIIGGLVTQIWRAKD